MSTTRITDFQMEQLGYNKVMEPETILKNGANSISQKSRGDFLVRHRNCLIFCILAIFCASCATTRIQEDSLAFLKGQRTLDVYLNFDDVLLQGTPEKVYLRNEQPQWVERWEVAKSTVFEENFLGHLNNSVRIQCGNYPNARYQATVFVLSVQRKGIGKHLEGPGTREVTCEVVFTKNGDDYPLATIEARGDSGGGQTYSFGSQRGNSIAGIIGAAGSNNYLTGKAFGFMGQNLGRTIAKRMK